MAYVILTETSSTLTHTHAGVTTRSFYTAETKVGPEELLAAKQLPNMRFISSSTDNFLIPSQILNHWAGRPGRQTGRAGPSRFEFSQGAWAQLLN